MKKISDFLDTHPRIEKTLFSILSGTLALLLIPVIIHSYESENNKELEMLKSEKNKEIEVLKTQLQNRTFINDEVYKNKQEAFIKILNLMERYIPYKLEDDETQIYTKQWAPPSWYIKKSGKRPTVEELRDAYNKLFIYSNSPETIENFIDIIGNTGIVETKDYNPVESFRLLRKSIRKELGLNDISAQSGYDNDNYGIIISEFAFNHRINLSELSNKKITKEHQSDRFLINQNIKVKKITAKDYKIYKNLKNRNFIPEPQKE